MVHKDRVQCRLTIHKLHQLNLVFTILALAALLLLYEISTPRYAVLECLDIQHLVLKPLSQLDKWVDNFKLQVVQVLLQVGVFAVFKEQLFFRQLLLIWQVDLRSEISVNLWTIRLDGMDLVFIEELI